MRKFKRGNANETKQSTSNLFASRNENSRSFRAYTDTEYKSPSLVCRRKIVVTELYSCFEITLRKQYLLFNEPTASVVSKFPPLPPFFFIYTKNKFSVKLFSW